MIQLSVAAALAATTSPSVVATAETAAAAAVQPAPRVGDHDAQQSQDIVVTGIRRNREDVLGGISVVSGEELQRDQPEAALGWITRGLALAPQDIRLRFLGGTAEAAAGRSDRARAYWQGLIDDAPPEAPWRAMLERRINALP